MTALEATATVLLFAHILGLAAVVGPYLLQARVRSGLDLRTMLVGAVVQLLSGFALVGLSQASDGADAARVATRLLLSLIVIGAVFIAQDRQRRTQGSRTIDPVARGALHVGGIAAIAGAVTTALWV